MPYKQKLKSPSYSNPKKKPLYKVTNWSAYNDESIVSTNVGK